MPDPHIVMQNGREKQQKMMKECSNYANIHQKAYENNDEQEGLHAMATLSGCLLYWRKMGARVATPEADKLVRITKFVDKTLRS